MQISPMRYKLSLLCITDMCSKWMHLVFFYLVQKLKIIRDSKISEQMDTCYECHHIISSWSDFVHLHFCTESMLSSENVIRVINFCQKAAITLKRILNLSCIIKSSKGLHACQSQRKHPKWPKWSFQFNEIIWARLSFLYKIRLCSRLKEFLFFPTRIHFVSCYSYIYMNAFCWWNAWVCAFGMCKTYFECNHESGSHL